MQVYRDYLSRGAHRYSSLLADLQVHNVPTHPALFWEDIACSHWFRGGGGGAAGANPLAGSVCPLMLASIGCFAFYAFSYCKPAEVWEKILVSAFPGRC